jgi:hypothetical protein
MNICGNGTSPEAKGIDTRALYATSAHARRDESVLTTEDISAQKQRARAIQRRGRDRNGLRPRSLNEKIYRWDPEDKLSAPWSIQKSPDGQVNETCHRSASELPHTIMA